MICSLLFLISLQAVEMHIQPWHSHAEFLSAALAGKLSGRATGAPAAGEWLPGDVQGIQSFTQDFFPWALSFHSQLLQ